MVKPSSSEEEYFAREDAEKKRKLALEQQRQMAKKEKEELKKLHHMHCVKCGMKMQEMSFRGVVIDRCFNCGGTFLDAGEFEKLAGAEGGAVMKSILNIFKK
jgi:hypothetical protein